MKQEIQKPLAGIFLKAAYTAIYQITKLFPSRGARVIDLIIFSILGNKITRRIILALEARPLKKIASFDSICVLVDVNIGDAVIDQALVFALRDFFPHARIDFVVKKTMQNLISGNKKISHVYGVYTGAPVPNKEDMQTIRNILHTTPYNVVINFCPFISKKSLKISKESAYVSFTGIIPLLMGSLKNNQNSAHMSWLEYELIYALFSYIRKSVDKKTQCNIPVFISPHAITAAKEFLFQNHIDESVPKIFLGVDTSSTFTKIPLWMQIEIGRGVLQYNVFLLIAAGHASKHFIDALVHALPQEELYRVKIVPNTIPLETYAVLIDMCEVYITGDTGPMHIAAARKYLASEDRPLRNKTALFSVFGATPPRVYGYDSQKPGFSGACQDAISKVYASKNKYRNITYINKHTIMCDENLFFDQKDIHSIISDVGDVLGKKRLVK